MYWGNTLVIKVQLEFTELLFQWGGYSQREWPWWEDNHSSSTTNRAGIPPILVRGWRSPHIGQACQILQLRLRNLQREWLSLCSASHQGALYKSIDHPQAPCPSHPHTIKINQTSNAPIIKWAANDFGVSQASQSQCWWKCSGVKAGGGVQGFEKKITASAGFLKPLLGMEPVYSTTVKSFGFP